MVTKISHIYLDHLGLVVVDSLSEEEVETRCDEQGVGDPKKFDMFVRHR